MSIPTVVLNEATPAGGDKVREGDDRIREYKTQNREIMDVDHKYDSSGQDADMGKHTKCSFIEQADLGTGAEGKPLFGAQTVSGKAELMFTDEDDNDIQVTSGGSLVATPSGTVYMFAGAIASIPSGYLACNGAAVSRTTYANLFTAISTIHGVGDGSTTFNLPDLRDVFVIGAKQDDSGTPKTNVSGSLTQSGGAATKDVSHTHTLPAAGTWPAPAFHSATGYLQTTKVGDYQDYGIDTAPATASGGSATQDVLNPYYVMLYMIKT